MSVISHLIAKIPTARTSPLEFKFSYLFFKDKCKQTRPGIIMRTKGALNGVL